MSPDKTRAFGHTGGTPTESTGGTPTESTGGTPTESTGGTPTESTGGTPTESTGGTPTESTGGTPIESTDAAPLNQKGADIQPGDVLGGKYRVERVLATGGMGVIVAAYHLQLDEHVAIKFLRDEILSDADAVARFAREASTAIKIKSEHVARVIDVGAFASGAPFMVMEYLEGEDLASWLRSRGALPIWLAVELVVQACEAIAEAHALGIVHRDIKPANLFVTRRADDISAVKVLDFGISKVRRPNSQGGSVTQRSVAVGSPAYMSPEQLASPADVDSRADVWALGVTLFEMLTGSVPFKADATPLVCGKILRDPPDPIRELRPEVPDGIQTILAKCLQKEREKRYENVGQLALALAEFGPERVRNSAQRVWRTVQAAGLPAKSGDAALLPPADRTTGSHPTRVVWDQSSNGLRPKRGPLRWVALTGLVGCALAGALAWRISVRGGPDADAGQVAAPGQVAEPSSVAAPSASQVAVEEPPAAPLPSSSAIVAKPIEARHSIELSGAAHPPMKTPLVIKRAPRVNTASTVSPRSKSANVFDDRN